MKYTKEQLDGMSDFEINKRIMVLLGYELSNWLNNNFGHYKYSETTIAKVKDYCKKWELIMPLAVEHGISLIKLNGDWMAIHQWIYIDDYYESTGDGCGLACDALHTFPHKSPQRAIACCLILVLQEQQP